jgi:hypothetical protein
VTAPSTYHSVEAKVEAVLAQWLAQSEPVAALGLQIRTRFSMTRETYPSVGIACREIEDALPDSVVPTGNWLCGIVVTVESKTNKTSPAEHDAIVGTVRDALLVGDLAGQLNTISQDYGVRWQRARMTGGSMAANDGRNLYATETMVQAHVIPSAAHGG